MRLAGAGARMLRAVWRGGRGPRFEVPFTAPPAFVQFVPSSPISVVADPFPRPKPGDFTGADWTVTSLSEWNTAVANCASADTITITSSFNPGTTALAISRNMGNNGMVWVRNANWASLPADRAVVPNDVTGAPVITSSATAGMMTVADGAQGWWLKGINIKANASGQNGFWYLGLSPATDAGQARRIILESCFGEVPGGGSGSAVNRNGMHLHGKDMIVERNCILGVAQPSTQCFAVTSYNGEGRYLIRQNIFEASGGAAIFGGQFSVSRGNTSGTTYNGDIAWCHNYYFRRKDWHTTLVHNDQVNMIEVKNGVRILIEGFDAYGFNMSVQQYMVNVKTDDPSGGDQNVVQCWDITHRGCRYHLGPGAAAAASAPGIFDSPATTSNRGRRRGNQYNADSVLLGASGIAPGGSSGLTRLHAYPTPGVFLLTDVQHKRLTSDASQHSLQHWVYGGSDPAVTADAFPRAVVMDCVQAGPAGGASPQYANGLRSGTTPHDQAGFNTVTSSKGTWQYNTRATSVALGGFDATNEVVSSAITLDSAGRYTSGNVSAGSTGDVRGCLIDTVLLKHMAITNAPDHAAAGLPARD